MPEFGEKETEVEAVADSRAGRIEPVTGETALALIGRGFGSDVC